MPKGVCGTRGLPVVLMNFDARIEAFQALSAAIMEFHAKQWEETAKTTHKWHNRPSEISSGTEESIEGDIYMEGNNIIAYLSMAGAGFYLETRCDLKDYAMLERIIRDDLPSLKKDLQALLRGGVIPAGFLGGLNIRAVPIPHGGGM